MYEEYLEHHGVKGMKWGVRRYQNYDGSYTQAGMKRFHKAEEAYDKADNRYKSTKSSYKSGEATKADVTNAKLARKKAKRQLEKDYKHLKQDKLADQGKNLYASGKTITGNTAVTNTLNKVGTVALSVAAYNAKSGGQVTSLIQKYTGLKLDDKIFTRVTAGIGAVAIGTSVAKKGADEYQNKRLRAYYSHTSKY